MNSVSYSPSIDFVEREAKIAVKPENASQSSGLRVNKNLVSEGLKTRLRKQRDQTTCALVTSYLRLAV